MSKDIKRVPDMRFKGFVDDWEQRKLKNIAKVNPKSNLPEKFEYVDLESVVGTKLISHRTEHRQTAPSRAKRLAIRGDVFYQMVRPYQRNNYLFDLPCDNFVFSTGYAQIRSYLDSYFLLNRLQEDGFVSQILNRCTGTSYPAIKSNDLAQVQIGYPILKSEQVKIGRFFKNLDNTIALHQEKLDKLKLMKLGFFQVMFPKKEESTPRLRFADYQVEWEQRKLGETVKITMGQSPKGENYTENPNDYILVQGNADIIDGTVSPRVWTTQVTKIANKGDIIISVRAPVGDIGKTQYNVVLGRGVAGIEGNEFIFQLLSKMKLNHFWTKYSTGSTFESINSNDLKDAMIKIPMMKEQKPIGDFFKKIDKSIVLYSKRIEKLKSLKKVYLQKMFI